MAAESEQQAPLVRPAPPVAVLAAFLAVAVFAAYWPALGAEFVQWDDHTHLTGNPRMSPPRWSEITAYWRAPFFGMYIPVTYSAWTAVAMVAWVPGADGGHELNPYVFHATNVLLHVSAAALVWALLTRLTRNVLAAWCGAVLFALHPLCVEAVAWVSGFRDVLGGLLAIAAIYVHVIAGEQPCPGRRQGLHVLAAVLFVLAILAKPASVAAIPMAVALDLWVRRPWRQTVWALAAWGVFAAGVIVVTSAAQPPPRYVTPLHLRPLIAGDALAFYGFKLVVPVELSPDAGRPPAWVLADGVAWKTSLATVVAGACVCWVGRRRRWVWLATGLFVAGLLPVLGLAPFSFQNFSTVADRYAYLALVGVGLAVAAGLANRPTRRGVAAAIVVAAVLGVLTFRQAGYWRTTQTLFSHTVATNPRSALGYSKLARLRLDEGDYPTAERLGRQSLELDDKDARVWANYGAALEGLGRTGDAESAYRRGIEVDTGANSAVACANLAGIMAERGDTAEAERLYRKALERDADLAIAHRGLDQLRRQTPSSRPTGP